MNVSQIYDGDGEPVEMKIELDGTTARLVLMQSHSVAIYSRARLSAR